jgi:hypothetical protein
MAARQSAHALASADSSNSAGIAPDCGDAMTGSSPPARFDPETLRMLDEAYEVKVATTGRDGSQRQKTIWIAVDGGEVFVRSVRGDGGRWFQRALARPKEVSLRVSRSTIDVTACLADDEASIARCSAALERKYRLDPALSTMLRPHALPTTLRLEPR